MEPVFFFTHNSFFPPLSHPKNGKFLEFYFFNENSTKLFLFFGNFPPIFYITKLNFKKTLYGTGRIGVSPLKNL
jgi:hypothetical protein